MRGHGGAGGLGAAVGAVFFEEERGVEDVCGVGEDLVGAEDVVEVCPVALEAVGALEVEWDGFEGGRLRAVAPRRLFLLLLLIVLQ